ncbi:hypothetical protein AZH11_06860 [Pseudomonas simiae]|nr:hypothetical protein AZH11_06860 [Pseudomonas simiae]
MSTVTPLTYDLLDLDPFSTINVDLRNTPNEKAVWGVGTKGLDFRSLHHRMFRLAWPFLE